MVKKIYNKTQEDFDTLLEYNDYLEFVETVVGDLSDNTHSTTAIKPFKDQLNEYKKINEIQIRANEVKRKQQKDQTEEKIARRKHKYEETFKNYQKQEEEVASKRRRCKAELMDNLENGEDAEEMLKHFNTQLEPIQDEIDMNDYYNNNHQNESDAVEPDAMYKYELVDVALLGPDLPNLRSFDYVLHVQEHYELQNVQLTKQIILKRTVEMALEGLFA